jgi:hypothetical protein
MMDTFSLGAAREESADLLTILTRFYRFLDANDIEKLNALMHPDSIWLRQGRELRTSADIAVALSDRDPRLHIFHILSGVMFEQLASDHVAYSGYLMVLRSYDDADVAVRMPPSGAQSLHVCEGEFRQTADGWRISAMNAGPPRLIIDIKGE